eukprot:659748-Pleurochrysis_carterae.AAC.1
MATAKIASAISALTAATANAAATTPAAPAIATVATFTSVPAATGTHCGGTAVSGPTKLKAQKATATHQWLAKITQRE